MRLPGASAFVVMGTDVQCLSERSSDGLWPFFQEAFDGFAERAFGFLLQPLEGNTLKPRVEFRQAIHLESVRSGNRLLLNLRQYPHQRITHVEAPMLELLSDTRQSF